KSYAEHGLDDFPTASRLTAIGWIRAMAGNEGGGSQPHLFETDGGFYIVKTRNNPQGERVLANELVGGLCLDWMGIKHPASAVVDIPADVITDSPSARFSDGNQLQNGLAFGSEYWQSDPGGTVDISLIVNRADAGATLVVDTWLPQHDSRQYRLRASSTIPGRYEYIPVEQGHCFGQPGWTASELAERTDVGIRPCPLPL